MVGKEVDRAAQSAAPKAMRHVPAQEVVTVRDRRDVVHQSSSGLGKTEIGGYDTIATRRSCGSRTPGAVGIRGLSVPRPLTAISLRGTPRRARASATAFARRSDSRALYTAET